MKKLLVFAVMIAMMLSSTISYAQESDSKKWELLETLAIYSGETSETVGSEQLTRGEFIIYLMKLMNKDYAAGESLYTDVDENDECYDAANNAKSLGYYNELEFRPDDDIRIIDAVEILERAMGYSMQLKSKSVLSVASELKLPLTAAENVMTYNEMTEIFYAALHAPIMKYDIKYGGTTTYKPDKNSTILSEYYKIEIIDGIMTANGITSIYTEDCSDKIAIDNDEYGDPNGLGKDYLGYNVRAYVDFSKDDEFGELRYIEERKNTVIDINEDEIDSVTDRVTKITYTKENKNKSETKKIDENAKVIYNGRFYADYKAEDLKPESGNIRLIDNDNDGTFEIIHIWNYNTIYIDRIVNDTIYNKYTYSGALESLKIDEGNVEYDIYWDGEKNAFKDLKAGQIISVAISKDGEYVRIEISKAEVKGTLNSKDTNERKLKIDGEVYKFTKSFSKEYTNLELGRNYTFYLNFKGEVSAAEKSSSDSYEYAYLYKVAYSEGEDIAYIKLFTKDGDWVRYSVADKLRIDGKKYTPSEIMDGKKGAVSPLCSEGETDRQIVKIRYEGDVLKEIKTSSETASYDEFNRKTENLNYYGQNNSFSSLFYINANTVIFGIPSDNPENTEAYVISPSLRWDGAYTVTAYGYDEYGDTDVFTIPIVSSTTGGSISNCIVLEKHKILNSDDEVIDALRCSFGMFEDFEIEIKNDNIGELKKGDLVKISTDYMGRIKSADLIYSWINEGEKFYSPDNLHDDSNLYGKVVKFDPQNKRIIMDLGGTRNRQPLRIDYDEIVVKKYNVHNNSCDLISINDIAPGDYLIMYSAGSNITSIIKYDKE